MDAPHRPRFPLPLRTCSDPVRLTEAARDALPARSSQRENGFWRAAEAHAAALSAVQLGAFARPACL